MSLHHIANHLASKGRNGDTTLVHMTKGEVAGLQALAKANGTSLTRNPDTGLPEAFGLKQLIPIAAGVALGPAGFGIASSAMGAGLMVGGAYALGTGSLKQGLIAGLGAYGGAGLTGAGAAAGTQPVAGTQSMAGEVTANAVPVSEATFTPVETINAGGSAMPATQQYAGAYQPTSFSAAPSDLATEMNAYSPTQTNYGAFGEAPGTVTEVPANQYGAFGEAPPTSATGSVPDAVQQNASASYGTAKPVNSSMAPKMGTFDTIVANAQENPRYLAAAAVPGIVDEMTPKPYQAPEIKSDSDPGQQYMFESGYDNSLPGRTGQPSYTKISSEEAKKYYGYAEGGEVQYPVGESVMRMAKGGQAAAPVAQADFTGYSPVDAYVAARGLGLGANYSGYDTPTNQGIAAVVPQAVSGANPNQRIIDLYKADEAKRAAEEAAAAKAAAAKAAISGSNYTIGKPGKVSIGANRESSGPDVVGVRANGTPVYGEFSADANGLYGPGTSQYAEYQRQQQASSYMAAEGGSVSPQGFGVDAGGATSSGYGNFGHGIDFSGYDTPVNQGFTNTAQQGNPNQRIVDLYKAADARRAAEDAAAAKQSRLYNGLTVMDNKKYGPLTPIYAGMTGAKMVGYDASGQPVYAGGYMDPNAYNPDANGVYGPGTVQYSMRNGTFMTNPINNNYIEGFAAGGGISTLGGYSDGGRLLKGPGDGMSDNIPAQIGAKQPARLADGEFVVPADVVSHLGNGSTDAGAKQLYKMMDKIRTARTGRKAQGKQVNPNKFLPV